ncbi:MAG: GNAT family N-acetyltransferase [Bacteroidota bacterium]|nr:GNAT family N-acetyltransferase [uncultured Allomuricauda sp.]
MELEIKERENKGFAIARIDGKKAGVMSFSKPGIGFIIIDHTEVEAEYRGSAVGKKLLYALVEMVREKGLKILPLCPFANAMFKKLDDIKDVLKT